MQNIPRMTILQAIFAHFQYVTQAATGSYSGDHYAAADGLIEVLEAADCGSHGGYDPANPNQRITRDPVFDRFLTLLRKYDDASGINPICGAGVDTLTRYFTEIHKLRSKIYNEE